MKRTVILAFIAFVISHSAYAEKAGQGIRVAGAVGTWQGYFEQSDQFNHRAELTTLASLGVGFQVGWVFSPFFVEYCFNWLISPHTMSFSLDPNDNRPAKPRDAHYFSMLGFNFGFTTPKFPIEPFVGVEKGSFGLSAGSKTDFGGIVGKLGATFFFGENFGVRAEYKRLWIAGDETGFFPEGISAQTNIIQASLVFGKR